jgi:uncharacterized ubiquitin-like protein YukD
VTVDFTPFEIGDQVQLRLPKEGFNPMGEVIDLHDDLVEVRWPDRSWGRYADLDLARVG